MGLYANYPIALAPGMGLNAFFAFTIVLTYKYTWQQALAAVFFSGILFFLISVFRLREFIIECDPAQPQAGGLGRPRPVPRHHRDADRPGSSSTIRRRWSRSAISRSRPRSSPSLGFVLIVALNARSVIGGTLIGILAVTLIGIPLGLTQFAGIVSLPPSLAPTFLQLDFSRAFEADLPHRGVRRSCSSTCSTMPAR